MKLDGNPWLNPFRIAGEISVPSLSSSFLGGNSLWSGASDPIAFCRLYRSLWSHVGRFPCGKVRQYLMVLAFRRIIWINMDYYGLIWINMD
jgi:hypothetical protein